VKHFLPSASLSDSVKWRIITSTGTNIAINFLRDGKLATVLVTPTNPPTKWYERRALRQILIDNAQKTENGGGRHCQQQPRRRRRPEGRG
jgi:hypothetical protein